MYLGPARVPEKNFIPCIISGHTVCISCYYNFFFFCPYYPQTLLLGLPDGAVGRQHIWQQRHSIFSETLSKCNFYQKYGKPLNIFTVQCSMVPYCESYFCSYLSISEGQPAKVKRQSKYQFVDIMYIQYVCLCSWSEGCGWRLCACDCMSALIDFWWFSVTGSKHPIQQYWSKQHAHLRELSRTHSRLTSNIMGQGQL